jgi:hypothetical protein
VEFFLGRFQEDFLVSAIGMVIEERSVGRRKRELFEKIQPFAGGADVGFGGNLGNLRLRYYEPSRGQ